MNFQQWEHLYVAFTGPILLTVVAYGFKFYFEYTERKEREHLRLAKQLIWETL